MRASVIYLYTLRSINMQICYFLVSLTVTIAAQEVQVDNKIEEVVNVTDILSWRAPEDFNTKFPFYHSGYDYENRAVIVLEYGKWNTRSAAEKGGEELHNLEKRQDQLVEQLRTSFFKQQLNESESGSHDDEFVLIMDLMNYDFTQFMSPPNLNYLVEYFAKLDKSYEKFAYGFIVNVSAVGDQLVTLFRIAAGKFLAKCERYGTNSKLWIPRILKKIPRDQLPPAYGGSEDFKPVSSG